MCKKALFIIVLLACLVSNGLAVPVLTNGGFKDSPDLTGWGAVSGAASTYTISSDAFEETKALLVDSLAGVTVNYVAQGPIAATASEAVTFSFMGKKISGEAGTKISVRFVVCG